MSRQRALVLLALSLSPQAVPALADRLARRGVFLADPVIRIHVRQLTAVGVVITQDGEAGQPVYALASGAAVDEALDRAWALAGRRHQTTSPTSSD